MMTTGMKTRCKSQQQCAKKKINRAHLQAHAFFKQHHTTQAEVYSPSKYDLEKISTILCYLPWSAQIHRNCI